MAADAFTSVDPPMDMPKHADIPPEDLREIREMFQKHPTLWGYFKQIIHVVDLMDAHPEADREVGADLERIVKVLRPATKHFQILMHFAAVCGFVEKSVSFGRTILQKMGKTYVTEDVFEIGGTLVHENVCLHLIRSCLISCTDNSAEFSLRLAKTGYLQDLLEDVKHIHQLPTATREKGKVMLNSLFTIVNCCKYPESAAVIKQLDIVPHIKPYLTTGKWSYLVQTSALIILAIVLEEDELDQLSMEATLCQFLLDNIKQTSFTTEGGTFGQSLKESLFHLHLFARSDFNKRLMVAQGILPSLHAALKHPRTLSEEEGNNAVTLISRLIEDPINLHVCQNYRKLEEILKGMAQAGTSATANKIHDILGKLEHSDGEELEERVRACPHVGGLLAEQSNLLTILHMGLAEWVLEQLHTLSDQRGSRAVHGEGACGQHVLRALTDLTSHPLYRTEIVARGGLGVLKTVLQTGSKEEKTEAARAVLGLTSAPETTAVIRIHTDMTSLLEDARQRTDNPDLAQLADSVLVVLHQ